MQIVWFLDFYFSSKPAIYNNMFLKQKNNVYIVEVHLKV